MFLVTAIHPFVQADGPALDDYFELFKDVMDNDLYRPFAREERYYFYMPSVSTLVLSGVPV